MKVRIKYCGGCNPGFDRVELVDKIRIELAGIVDFVSPMDPGIEALLVIEGCSTACADVSEFMGLKVWMIKDLDEAREFVENMLDGFKVFCGHTELP